MIHPYTNEPTIRWSLIVTLAVIAVASVARAEDAPAPAATASPASGQTPAPLAVAGLSVLADGSTKKGSLNFQMGDAIHVKLEPGNLARLQVAAAEKRKKLGLSLNGHFLTDVPALVIGTDELVFLPNRSGDQQGVLGRALGRAAADATDAVGGGRAGGREHPRDVGDKPDHGAASRREGVFAGRRWGDPAAPDDLPRGHVAADPRRREASRRQATDLQPGADTDGVLVRQRRARRADHLGGHRSVPPITSSRWG